MSRNSRRHRGGEGDPGVNPLIIKGMQDRMETINKNIDEIQTRSMDGYNTVMQFSDSFFALKKKQEEESEARERLEEKLNFVNKIVNNMDLQQNASCIQQDTIDKNLLLLKDASNRIQNFASVLEANMNRDKDHNMKVIVNTRILAQETKTICVKYMKDTNHKLDHLRDKFDKQIDKKDELSNRLKELDDTYDEKQSALSAVLNKLTGEID